MVLNEHLPRPGILTPDLPTLSPKVLSTRLQCWCASDYTPLNTSPSKSTPRWSNSTLDPSLIFPFHVLPSLYYHTGFTFYIFPGFLAIFISLLSNNNNNNNNTNNRILITSWDVLTCFADTIRIMTLRFFQVALTHICPPLRFRNQF